MPKRPDISQYRSFDAICDRLDSIISDVRDKDTSLERSLDLFDEAIALGSAAVEMVDVTELSPAEEAKLEAAAAEVAGEDGGADETDDAAETDNAATSDDDGADEDVAPSHHPEEATSDALLRHPERSERSRRISGNIDVVS